MAGQIHFTDGSGYERYMGRWSQLVGHAFLDWLAPPAGSRWLDVGCGSGAFTEMLVERCAPAAVHGIDPSEAQLAFARRRPAARIAEFHLGDAMSLPFPDDAFDAAVMPLVIFFVPVPARGVAEMARVVRSGGIVSAYAWDLPGGGLPYDALVMELRARGVDVPEAPNPDASRIDALHDLWRGAGLVDIRTHEITVRRTFESFADYWETVQLGASVGPPIAALPTTARANLEARMRAILPVDADGRITYGARANAVAGRVS